MNPRARLLDQERQRAALGHGPAEDVVVLDAHAGGHEQAIEESELLLKETGDRLRFRAEAVRALHVGGLPPVLDAERARRPRADVEMIEPLHLAPLDLEEPGKVAGRPKGDRRARERVRRIDELLPVPVPPDAHVALPPRDGPGVRGEIDDQCLRLLPRVRVDRWHDRLRIRDEFDRHARVRLVPAERHPDVGVARQRQAHARVERVLIYAVVDRLAVRLEVTEGERVIEDALGARKTCPRPQRVVVADLLRAPQAERALASARDDVDHAADRVRAVERRLRTANDLDALDQLGREVGEIDLTERGTLHAHAIDEHLHLIGVGAADRDRGRLAEAPGASDVDTRHTAERLVHRRITPGVDVVTGNHRHRRAELLGRRLEPRRRHHHGLGLLDLLRCDDVRHEREHQDHHCCPDHAPLLFCERVGRPAPGRFPDSWIDATAHAFPSRVAARDSGSRVTLGPGRRSPLTVARPCRHLTGFPRTRSA